MKRPTHSIEFVLEKFQEKENDMHCSPEYTFDDTYQWWLVFQRNVVNRDFVGIYLRCKSLKANFPVYVNPTFTITNHKNKKEESIETDCKMFKSIFHFLYGLFSFRIESKQLKIPISIYTVLLSNLSHQRDSTVPHRTALYCM